MLLQASLAIYAQVEHDGKKGVYVHFRQGESDIDGAYMNNNTHLTGFVDRIKSYSKDSLTSCFIRVLSSASPEGEKKSDTRLVKRRAKAIADRIGNEIKSDIKYDIDSIGVDWNMLIENVEMDSAVPYRDEVLEILHNTPEFVVVNGIERQERQNALRRLRKGVPYQYIFREFYPRMRYASARCEMILTEIVKSQPVDNISSAMESVNPTEIPVSSMSTLDIPVVTPKWYPKLHIKTNALFGGMGIVNISPEIDFAKHWSFTLPVSYSAWNYFKTTIKFRTVAIQPELRYWLSENKNGFFAGAHFGLAYYNIAFDNDYRYQDHNRETPLLGGGVSAGYRLPISKDNCWRVEFSLGAGVYSCHYDKFHNTPDTKNGLMIESAKKTYFGIDQVAVSFLYTFDLRKKGGKR